MIKLLKNYYFKNLNNNKQIINTVINNKNNKDFINYVNKDFLDDFKPSTIDNFKIIESCIYNNIFEFDNRYKAIKLLINNNPDILLTCKTLYYFLNKEKKRHDDLIILFENKLKDNKDWLLSYICINYLSNYISNKNIFNEIFKNINIKEYSFEVLINYLDELNSIPTRNLISNIYLEKEFFSKLNVIFKDIINNDLSDFKEIFNEKLLLIPLICIKGKFNNNYDFYKIYLENYKNKKGMFRPNNEMKKINKIFILNYLNLLSKLNYSILINKQIYLIIEQFLFEEKDTSFLLQIFQKINLMGYVDDNLNNNFYKIFQENLENISFFELTVRLIPSLSISSKKYFTKETNILPNQMSHEKNEENKNLEELKKWWIMIENYLIKKQNNIEVSKIIQNLIHFIPVFKINKELKIFENLLPLFKNKLNTLNNDNISKLIYCYSRIKFNNKPFLIDLLNIFIKTYNKAKYLDNITALWGISYSGIIHSDFFNKSIKEILTNNQKNLLSGNHINLLVHLVALNKNILDKETINLLLNVFKKNLYYNFKNLNINTILMNLFYFMCIDDDNIVLNHLEKILNNRFDLLELNDNNLYYIYLYYCHNYIELKLRNNDLYKKIKLLIKNNNKKIINYYYYSKKIVNSKLELNFKELLIKNDIYKKEDKKKLIEIEGSNLNFLYLSSDFLKENINNSNFLENFGSQSIIFPYNFDLFLDSSVIEVNGPHHYLLDIYNNSETLNGVSQLKTDFIKKFNNLKLKEINYKEINQSMINKNSKNNLLNEIKEFLY